MGLEAASDGKEGCFIPRFPTMNVTLGGSLSVLVTECGRSNPLGSVTMVKKKKKKKSNLFCA